MKIGLFPYEIGGKKHEEQTIQIRRGILHSVNHHNREYGGGSVPFVGFRLYNFTPLFLDWMK